MSAVAPLPLSNWTTGRKVAASLFALISFTALAAAAVYLSAALFLLLNKADPRQARFTSIAAYWRWYGDDAALRKKLVAAISVSGLVLLVVLPGALYAATRPRRLLHGDARFANRSEVVRAGLIGQSGFSGLSVISSLTGLIGNRGNRGKPTQPSILIGRYRGQYLALPGQLSVMLSAPTRSGKGVGVVIPNLLNWPDSAVVLDIKGENHAITAGYRAECGQGVYAFSPFDEAACSHRWNPLTTVRTSALHRVGDLLAIGQVFFPNDGSSTSSEAFFNDQARNLFLAMGLLLLETPALPRTIGEMLRQSSGKGQPLKDHLTSLIALRKQDESSSGSSSSSFNGSSNSSPNPSPLPSSSSPPSPPPFSDECVDALQRLLSNSENTLSSIVATFNAPLTIFADAVVDAATSADDFALQDVRRRRMTIYVRIPPNRLASARPLLNLFFSQLVNLNTQHLPEQDPSLKLQCLLVHDEFTAMGRVGIIASAAAFLAGYNLRLLTVVQAMSQLDAVYGDKEARTFATNHGLQILFAPREQRDADEYSAMLGHFTERATSRGRSHSFSQHSHRTVSANESEQRRALLLPQEFKELGSERLVVIVENCKPILADKIRYHRDKTFKARLRQPPAVPQMNMGLHLARVQQRWRDADDELPVGEDLKVENMAQDFSDVPMLHENSTRADIDTVLTIFFDRTCVGQIAQDSSSSSPALASTAAAIAASTANTASPPGGAIEQLSIEDLDETEVTTSPVVSAEVSPDRDAEEPFAQMG